MDENSVVRILLIEDNPGDARLILEMLKESPAVEFIIEPAESLASGLAKLRETEFDLVLLDLGLPDSQGEETLMKAIRAAQNLPVVVLTGLPDDVLATKAVNEGAQDYLLKGSLDSDTLIRTVRYAIDRKRAEMSLRESEERYRALFDNSIDGVLLTLPDGTIYAANPTACQILGRTEEEICRIGGNGIVDPEDEQIQALLEERERTGRARGEINLLHADGRSIPCEISSSVFTDKEGRTRTSIVFRDITARRKAEEALKASERSYRSLVDNSLVGIYKSNLEGRFLYINEAMAKIFGCDSAEEMLRKDVLTRYRNAADRESLMTVLKESGSVSNFEVDVPTKSGELKTILISATLDGDVISGMVIDITGEKRLEAQLRQSQKIEAVGQLAGGVAHDVNNILSAIFGYAQILQMKMRAEDPLKGNVEQILHSVERATQVTHGLLAFSRKQVMNQRPVDLNEIIRRTGRLLGRIIGEDIEMETALSDEALNVVADSGQIEQVLMNLVTNARDAMPAGGRLAIRSERTELSPEFVRFHGYGEPGSYALVSVIDSGVGMDGKTREKIFEPFFTTKEVGRGTGLGLAMAYGIVKQHKGFINVYSEPGQGTTFRIYLPLTGLGPEKARPPAEGKETGGGETILVAEDDPTLRKLVGVVLTEFGYRTILAADGDEAIAGFSERKDEIDACLLDIIMPKRGGRDACEEIKKMRPDMKVLFMSGYTDDRIKGERLSGEGVDFIRKPVSPRDLLRKLRRLLDG